MSKVSIIIPVRGEKQENLQRTLDSIWDNVKGDYEVIVGYNGSPFILPKNINNNYLGIFLPRNVGIKTNINMLAALATGDYILKTDAHCSFSEGFDEILKADMQDDWIVTPRFFVLDGKTWEWQDERFYDYFYLSCPFTDKRGVRFKAGGHWQEKTQEKLNVLIDETPQIHGSCWFMKKDHFFKLGGFPIEDDPYGHGQEPIWLALKNWLRGGKVMINKKCWYAHLHQNSKDRGYPENEKETEFTYSYTANYWLRNKDSKAIYKFEWFVEKFMPMPTWPKDWFILYSGGFNLG